MWQKYINEGDTEVYQTNLIVNETFSGCVIGFFWAVFDL